MKSTAEYLDAVKDRLQIPSDYALAKNLGLTRESISQFRSGKSAVGIETAMKIGEILRIDGHAVYADGQIERAKNTQVGEFWREISEKFSASFKALLPGCGPRQHCV